MRRKTLSLLLALCMALALLPGTARAAEASGTCGDDLTWSYSDGTLTIQGTGSMDSYDPGTKTFLERPWEDYVRQIHTINIGDGVTTIGEYAFAVCENLTSVTIPGGVTAIGNYAFYACNKLTGMAIPGSITAIGEGAFMLCISLTSMSIPSSVISIGDGAFSYCYSLASVDIPNSVTGIGDGAFSYCYSLTNVSIPSSFASIGDGVFNSCSSLTSVDIPNSVTSIGSHAFYDCSSLTDVYYSGSESQWEEISVDSANDGNAPLFNAIIHYEGPTQAPIVVLSPQKLAVNGANVDCEKYNIDGANYFKLRDLAYMLSGTASQFDVGFDAATSTVAITTGAAYTTPNGGELQVGADNSGTAQISRQTILINGVARNDLTVYNIGGSNFFKLRELGDALGFEVGYDQPTNTAIVLSR